MTEWRVYYGDGSVVCGTGSGEWDDAPDDDVQVVALMEPGPAMGWSYETGGRNVSVRDRQLWTGQDTYDPFGWGVKYGAWMSDADYFELWNRACSE